MSTAHSLCLLLALLYLSDCFWWLPWSSSAIEQIWPGTRWRLRLPPSWAGNRRGVLLALAPLPQSVAVQFDSPSFSLSPTGCAAGPPAPAQATTHSPQRATLWSLRWEDVDSIETRGEEVFVNSRQLHQFPLRKSAERLAARLELLRNASPSRRQALLLSYWREDTNLQAIEGRCREVERSARLSRWGGLAQWLWMFVVAPVTLFLVDGTMIIATLGGFLILMVAANVGFFARRHLQLFPDERWARWEAAAMMCVSWPMAARSADTLSRHRLAGFHPFAVVMSLPDSVSRTHYLGRALRATEFPLGLEELDPLGHEIVRWQAGWHFERFRELAAERDFEVEAIRLPLEFEPEARSYCPRCLATFMQERPECSYCHGIALRPAPQNFQEKGVT